MSAHLSEPLYSRGFSSFGRIAASILLGVGCGTSAQGGVSVDIVSAPIELPAGAVLPADSAMEVRVDTALWTNASVELVACPSLARRVMELVIPSAHAHGEAAPTRTAEPVLQSAFSARVAELGTLSPPAAEYCSVTYRMGPADQDAVHLDDTPDMLGLSVLVRGAFRQPGGDWQSFEIDSAAEVAVEVTPLALDLSRSGTGARVSVVHDPRAWWSGIEFSGSTSPAEREAVLLGNIERSVRVDVE